ncbi:MAG TPA: hypothetical protein VJ302_31540 [Blastocatellia bacterium]|nr:hypothetical protein [Blastocatellia bacterium]
MMTAEQVAQQKEYLIERAAQIASFAISQHERQGRGIVVIGWPAPELFEPEEILDHSSYLSEDALGLAGLDSAEELVRAVQQYNPARQAIVMCIEALGRSFNVHVLTAIYGYAGPQSQTSH